MKFNYTKKRSDSDKYRSYFSVQKFLEHFRLEISECVRVPNPLASAGKRIGCITRGGVGFVWLGVIIPRPCKAVVWRRGKCMVWFWVRVWVRFWVSFRLTYIYIQISGLGLLMG